MKIQGPSGRIYEWTKATPPTEADMAELQRVDSMSYEVQSVREIMRDPKTTGPERLGAIAPYLFYKGRDVAASMGIRGGSAAAGQTVGQRIAGKPGAIVGGGLGAALGSVADQARLMAQGQQQEFSKGQLIGDVISGANPARGIGANALVNAAATQAESLMDTGKMAPLEQTMMAASMGGAGAAASKMITGTKKNPQETRRAREDETYRLAMREGYILDPAKSAPNSTMNRMAVGLAGEPQLQRELSIRNQQVTNNIARKELGIDQMVEGADLPITDEVLAYNRWLISEPYRKLGAVADEAPALMKDLSKKRNEARTLWRKYARDADPEAADRAALADEAAEKLENSLEELARNKGTPELVQEMRGARRILAKNHVIDSSFNRGTGDVSANVIGKIYDSKKMKLDEGLEVIGRLQQAMPKVLKEAAETSAPGGGHFRTWMTGAAGAVGYKMGGWPGALGAAGAVAYGDIPIRKAITSPLYQKTLARQTYPNIPNPEDFLAVAARLAPQAVGRREELPNPGFLRYMTNQAPF